MATTNERLREAARTGSEVKLKSLLRNRGCDALVKDKDGWTALMHAAHAGHEACIQALLSASDALAKDRVGMTALMWAARKGDEGCVRLLLPVSNALAQAQVPGIQGLTALMIAASRGNEACVGMLLPMSDILAKDKKGRTAGDWARVERHESLAHFIDAYVMAQSEQASIGAAAPGAPRGRVAPRV